MKKIEAVIRSSKLDEVENALNRMSVDGMTVYQVIGSGRHSGCKTEVYRGTKIEMRLLPRVKVEVIVRDNDCDLAIEKIQQAAETNKTGDGIIWVTNVENLIRIKNGESDMD